jgi:hypothetical protein
MDDGRGNGGTMDVAEGTGVANACRADKGGSISLIDDDDDDDDDDDTNVNDEAAGNVSVGTPLFRVERDRGDAD